MTNLYQIIITRTDRASLDHGAVIGFSTTVSATNLQEAQQLAEQRLERCDDRTLLYIESIKDVTPAL
jgi:hypothetical protein